jgi:hypothetical protein
MSNAADGLNRSERILFAGYVSVILAGPLAGFFFPFVYWKPRWFVDKLFVDDSGDRKQARLDEFGGAT